jgi:hypothetical protein
LKPAHTDKKGVYKRKTATIEKKAMGQTCCESASALLEWGARWRSDALPGEGMRGAVDWSATGDEGGIRVADDCEVGVSSAQQQRALQVVNTAAQMYCGMR